MSITHEKKCHRQLINFIIKSIVENKNIFNFDKLYRSPEVSWVETFMDKARLFPSSGCAWAAVSAGLDSMSLLFTLYALYKKGRFKKLSIIHVNHGTRKSNIDDELLIKKWANQLNLPLKVENLKLNKNNGNFEHIARNGRYKSFNEILLPGDRIYTAHHLNDSFEWSLLSGLKTSARAGALGIPVLKKQIARPFLSMSRKHIERFAKKLMIPFNEDPTNTDRKFERNYLRHEIIPNLKKRFPAYLKHYVHRVNDLSKDLNISRLLKKSHQSFPSFYDEFGGCLLIQIDYQKNFDQAEDQIIKIIKTISNKSRGVLRSQVKKLLEAQKVSKKGPILFSGGVLAYLDHGMIYFIHRDRIKLFKEIDLLLLEELKKIKDAYIPSLGVDNFIKKLHKNSLIMHTRILVFGPIGQMNSIFKKQKGTHPLFFESTNWANKNDMWWGCTTKLIYYWIQERNKKKSLPVFIF